MTERSKDLEHGVLELVESLRTIIQPSHFIQQLCQHCVLIVLIIQTILLSRIVPNNSCVNGNAFSCT